MSGPAGEGQQPRHLAVAPSSSHPERQPVRIVDLAAELGLSKATISRALSNNPAVRPEVARRVQQHAAARGYVANRLARSLRDQHRTFVGFLVPDVENATYSIAADACAQYVARSGNQLILAISGDDGERELQAIRSLAEAQVGAIIVAASQEMSEESRRLLSGMPVVEFNRSLGLSRDGVFCDDRAGFAQATRYLLELGHREIGYVGSTDAISNGRERLEGVRQELLRHGLPLPERRVVLAAPTEADGFLAAQQLLSAPDRPTALLVGGSNLSIGAARAVRRLGIAMPEDLSLVVYGDADWGGMYTPTLTTIKVPYREMARTVANGVAGRLSAGDDQPAGEVRLAPELVVRESTAPPRRPGEPLDQE